MSEKTMYEVTRGLWMGNTLHPAGTRIEEGAATEDQIATWLRTGAIRQVAPNVEPPAPPKPQEPKIIRANRGSQPPAAAEEPKTDEVSE